MSTLTNYQRIADHFSETRRTVWQFVQRFLDNTRSELDPQRTILIEAGCGNGKNLAYGVSLGFSNHSGYDSCERFVELCQERGLRVAIGDVRDICILPEYENCIILCIAVIHHLREETERIQAVRNLIQMIQGKRGRILISVWSLEQSKDDTKQRTFLLGDNLVPWHSKNGEVDSRYYFIYDETHWRNFIDEIMKDYPELAYQIGWERQNWYVEIVSQ